MIQGIHHVAISVPDMALARKFYGEVLGLEEVRSSKWGPGNDYVDAILGLKDSSGLTSLFRGPNVFIEVFEYLTPKPGPLEPARPVNEYGYTHFGIQVDDIAAVHERMLAAGLTFHTAPARLQQDADGGRIGFSATYGRDFFGNVFEIMEIRPGSQMPPVPREAA